MAFYFSSCYKDNRENLNPQLPTADNGSSCDTTAVTYQKDIQSIMTSCTSCHTSGNASGGYKFDSQTDVANSISKVISATTNGSMPMGSSPLSACKINKLKAWANQGLK